MASVKEEKDKGEEESSVEYFNTNSHVSKDMIRSLVS